MPITETPTRPARRPWFTALRAPFLLLALLLAVPANGADPAGARGRDPDQHPEHSHSTPARTRPSAARSRATPTHAPAHRAPIPYTPPRIPRPEPAHTPAHIDPHYFADHRYGRPEQWHVRALPGHPAPRSPAYEGWYTHWWVHPYWRWVHATTAVVNLGFRCMPWDVAWVPPFRPGWQWAPGHWGGTTWTPGHWEPLGRAPVGYVFVPGFWVAGFWVEGHWRVQDRRGWRWVDGAYVADGVYQQGHWQPAISAPVGRVWEPGFWDGEIWVEGFWRPVRYPGYSWVSARWGDDGVYRCGYWEPTRDRPGFTWVPGWFDGTEWQGGYWVSDAVYQTTDTDRWQPPTDDSESDAAPGSTDGPPLALPTGP